ncbi:uncharacterized protein [Venturia canescens]|uniref:uncharacterized protein isoform X2 n=1 Tax=Venturia canescens TaxID=32260 RepID=UPI001C9C2A97|nr:uncharacterized protein LOC122415052 isoform X2 [Venturia canescens]
MGLKTKSMRKILEPIEVQMHQLRLLSTNDFIKAADITQIQSIVFEQLNNLAEKFSKLPKEDASNYQEMKSKITSLIEEFCLMKNIKQLVPSPKTQSSKDVISVVLEKFRSSLETLERLECEPLKQQLQDCWDYVKEMGAVEQIEDFQNIKELGMFIIEIFEPLQRYRKNLISPLFREKMALYTGQLCTSFAVLVEVIQEQHQLRAPIYSAKKYVCDRLCWCFKMIIELLDASSPTEEEENFEKENHFVYRMDLVLDIISSMPGKTNEQQLEICKDLWAGIEDVFSHALGIAQVCQPYNFKAITGASQSIMSEYENLKVQLESDKSDPTLNNLFMNTLNDALYRLERKVNISVLTLVMEVFSDPFSALRKLVKSCGNPLTVKKRSRNDLSKGIEDFDQLTDKAMQIGMFAIACCNDVDRITKIRHCMASLESLESEFVPATVAFYLHPDNKEMRACIKILITRWQAEMNKLHNVVDLIIDSAAYCQVILDDLQDRISKMSDCLDNREGVTRIHVQVVVQRAIALATQVTAAVNDIGREKIDRQTIMMILELKIAIYEADGASKTLLVENATDSQQLRVIKRCELILNVVKRLQPALVTVMNSTITTSSGYGKAGMGQGDSLHASSAHFPSSMSGPLHNGKFLTYIRTPYTVQNYKPPLSIQPANSAPRTPTDLSSLIPYIQRGRTMRTDRSIMYKTPKNSEIRNVTTHENRLKMRNLSCIRQHLFSRDSFISQNEIDLSNESLELTAILDKLTCLSDTLSSIAQSSMEPDEKPPKSKHSRDPIGDSMENISVASSVCLGRLNERKSDECSVIGGGDAPSSIATPEKVEDIQRIDKEIEILQKQFKTLIIN